jgi:integrase
MTDYDKILTACRTQEQRAILVLARIGGLRIPSEISTLTWSDVLWDIGKIWVTSPKTEHHTGKAGRFIPLWEPIRRELEALFFADEPDGKDDRVFRNRNSSSNLRTRFCKIQIRAGIVPMDKFFTNCRASRSTEVFESYGAHLESQWIGHSQAVAMRHYYQVRDVDYQAALEEKFESKPPMQVPSEITGKLSVGDLAESSPD